ncbi:uroporphyrinogen-III decarboxylase [Methanomicrobium sp. W14]|uniref:uroporphyrinogen decarboxylase family protein n=1 Tax=Methanomicrobium sp. W14 TaxID=2817839 RepID=UPI001AE894B1|nr:uroporphyrinogen decarboxylase family protein [Methanomicrobium sp. W14]MBP2134229.1 uroporphyrinogen-III decarboxylase [Methanomicrobium sp. W14]
MDAKEVYKEKITRLDNVIKGKTPDRTPVLGLMTLFQAHYSGYTAKEIFFNPEKNKKAILKVAKDFDMDSISAIGGLDATFMGLSLLKSSPELVPPAKFMLGNYHQILGDVFTKWPGIELEDDAHPQFIGSEIMKLDEYDQFIADPIGFLNSVALPRICKNLANPGSPKADAALSGYKAELAKSGAFQTDLVQSLAGQYGVPTLPMGWSYAPLDFVGDFMRDIKHVVLDFYRHGDKVKAAVDALTPYFIECAKVTGAIPPEVQKAAGTDIVECFFPLHLNEYLNPRLYDEYYWPSLRKVFEEVIKMGQTPYVLFEGRHDAHLETLLELPKGKVIGVFDKTDPRKVREVLDDHVVLAYGPPNSLLIGGTPQKVDSYMKSMLDDCKDGGMIVFPGVDGGISGNAKPENVKALIEAVKKYGTY